MVLQKPSPCPLCASEPLRRRANELYDSDATNAEIAGACKVTLSQVVYHYEHCAAKIRERDERVEAEAKVARERVQAHSEALAHVQATPGDSRSALCVLDGPTLIARLNNYLTQIETLIHTPDPTDPKKLRVSLAALDQARKTVETMSKLYLDVMKAQLDAEVQGEFRRIVMECINAADPATRQRIIAEIQSRTAIFGTLGGAGM